MCPLLSLQIWLQITKILFTDIDVHIVNENNSVSASQTNAGRSAVNNSNDITSLALSYDLFKSRYMMGTLVGWRSMLRSVTAIQYDAGEYSSNKENNLVADSKIHFAQYFFLYHYICQLIFNGNLRILPNKALN